MEPLRWAPAHPIVVDDHGGGYHRVWCPSVDDQDGTTGTHVAGGEPLPPGLALHAFPRCHPQLVLKDA